MKKIYFLICAMLASVAINAQMEVEPNNDFPGNAIQLDATISTTMPPNDIDIYQVQVNYGGTLEVNLTDIPNDGFYGLRVVFDILASDQTTVIAEYRHPANPYWPNSASFPAIVCPGTYYIKLFLQGGGSTTPFHFTAHLDTTDSYECNNDSAFAPIVPLNTPFQAKIYGYNQTLITDSNPEGADVDYYKVYIPQDGALISNFSNIPLSGFYGLPLEFYIYAPDQTTLVAHYYHSGDPYFPTSISYPTVLGAGWYYIKVNCSGSDSLISSTQSASPYDVIFNFEACEENDSFNTSCAHAICDIIHAKIYQNGDKDFYSITGTGVMVTANLTSVPTNLTLKLTAYDASQAVIGLVQASVPGAPVSVNFMTSVGETYYIAVSANNLQNNSQEDYILSITDTNCSLSTDFFSNESAHSFTIYPNPSKGNFTIDSSNSFINENATVLLYNLLGQKIQERTITSKATKIELNEPDGIYLVKIVSAQGNYFEKVTIQQ